MDPVGGGYGRYGGGIRGHNIPNSHRYGRRSGRTAASGGGMTPGPPARPAPMRGKIAI